MLSEAFMIGFEAFGIAIIGLWIAALGDSFRECIQKRSCRDILAILEFVTRSDKNLVSFMFS